MKKILSLIIVLVMMLTLLAGCGDNDTSAISGRDAAMLLLANERLNKDSLNSNGDVFTVSSQVFSELSRKAIENLEIAVPDEQYSVKYTTLSSGAKYPVLSLADAAVNTDAPSRGAAALGSFGEEKTDIGRMEVNGETVIFSEFEEVSNSYEYFLNLTNNIVTSANIAADIIDFVKKNIRVVDKWVELGQDKYYLHVGENEELMCKVDTFNNTLDICRRHKNADGVDVYELYREAYDHKTRMTYIPGERYELSVNDLYFTADNSKGYWISYVVGEVESHYNISYLVLKDDICFQFGVNLDESKSYAVQILSSDRQTDIFNISEDEASGSYMISLCAFNGIEKITVPKSDVQFGPDNSYANCSGSDNMVIHTASGRTVTLNDGDGNVDVISISVMSMAYGYVPEMYVRAAGDTTEERIDNLLSFFEGKGLTCRRNANEIKDGISRAVIDRDYIIKYYTWLGENVSTRAGVEAAVAKEKARYGEMYALYAAVKDLEVIDYSDTEAMELNMSFPQITSVSVGGTSLSGKEITVSSVTLTVSDTSLIVTNEPYRVALALENSKGALVHLEQSSASANEYSGEGAFTATATDIRLTLPMLETDSYRLVAYIATSDGIRSSKCAAVTFDASAVDGMPVVAENTELTAAVSSNTLVLTYTEKLDVFTSLSSKEALDFASFDKLVRELAFNYGYTDGNTVEIKGGNGAYTVLSDTTEQVPDGEYRIKYSVINGEAVKSGYIYISFDSAE